MSENATVIKCKVEPSKGLITWAAEGNEGGQFHSRTLHVPSNSSGLTIGRGYDMKQKNAGKVVNDLVAAGIPSKQAKILAKGTGLKGVAAKKFIKDNKLTTYQITLCTQKNLFDITYKDEAAEAKRVCEKADVAKKYGKCDFDKMHPAIEEIVVDLKFRGDYNPNTRRIIQKAISNNDLEAFTKLMSKKAKWPNVPNERFKNRKMFLEKALKQLEKSSKLNIKPFAKLLHD
mgnify:CR=1 FL=1